MWNEALASVFRDQRYAGLYQGQPESLAVKDQSLRRNGFEGSSEEVHTHGTFNHPLIAQVKVAPLDQPERRKITFIAHADFRSEDIHLEAFDQCIDQIATDH